MIVRTDPGNHGIANTGTIQSGAIALNNAAMSWQVGAVYNGMVK